MMGGKYSAEWWEKITDVNRETTARHDRSHLVDDLIQATANGKRSGPASLRNLGRNSPVSNLIFLNGLHAARGRLRRNVPVRAPSRTAARVFGAKTWANSVAYPTDNSRGCALNFCRFASGPFRHFATIAGCNAAASSDGGLVHGKRRFVAKEGGGVLGEGACDQRSATCAASPRASP